MRRITLLTSILAVLLFAFGTLAYAQAVDSGPVRVARIQGVINPPMAGYVQRVVKEAENGHATALVLEMDTPGGLMTSMRDITGAILNARVPVIVYVSPQGARAASAGVFITMSAHVAAMSPNTNIGSAHPVGIGGEGQSQPDPTMTEKVVNDAVAQIKEMAQRNGRNAEWAEKSIRESANLTSNEALDLRVIDYSATDLNDLLKQVDGRSVRLADGSERVLRTAGAVIDRSDMNPLEGLLHAITDPTIAYILLTLGINALAFELASPGAVLPGVTGVILVLLAFYALGTLSVNLTAVALIIVGFLLLFGEVVLAPGYGAMGVGGLAALALGSVMLMQSGVPFLSVSPWAVAAVLLVTFGFFFIALRGVIKAHRKQVATGEEGMVGMVGEARTRLDPVGSAFVDGELWEARATSGVIEAGSEVRVTAMRGITLVVEAVESDH